MLFFMQLGSQAEWITGQPLVISSSIRISWYLYLVLRVISSTYCGKCRLTFGGCMLLPP